MRFTLRRLDSLAVLGESLRGVFDGIVDPDRIAVVPNGTPDLSPNGRLGSGKTVLFLSNLRRRKGVVESVQAALKVLERRPDVTFLFAGTPYDEELERELRAAAAPVGDRIRFLPAATGDEKRTLLLSSAILLFPPSEPEGHPRVILEAMSAGLPVVTTDRGAIAETVADGETGYVLPDPDPAALAERLLRLLDDAGLRGRMARASRERYLELFTQDRADERLADWLAGLGAS
jgi:glycosyltransferase involved in cell wall biosynthesis